MPASNTTPFTGRLGQTSRSSVQVTSDAGSTFSTTVYTSVNVTRNPELVESLTAGTLNVAICPVTGKEYPLAVPTIYHDESAHTFALVIPSVLRHEEFKHRRRLLEQLEQSADPIPAYARNFITVYDVADIDAVMTTSPTNKIPVAPAPDDLQASKDMARQRAILQEQKEELQIDRQQLEEVRLRLDSERGKLDQLQDRIREEQQALEADQLELQKQQLAEQAKSLMAQKRALDEASGAIDEPVEATQVVTDDQFIEVFGEAEANDLASDVSEIEEDIIDDFEPEDTMVNALTTGLPKAFKDIAARGERAIKVLDGHVVAAAKVGRGRIESLFEGTPEVFLQLHEIDGYPVVGLVIGNQEEGQNPTDVIAWALDFADDAHRVVFEKLKRDFTLRFGLYDQDKGTLLRAIEVQAPLKSNLLWVLEHAQELLGETKKKGKFLTSAKTYVADKFEYFGNMRHNFGPDSFTDIESPTDIKVAAGIVGFWSQPEKRDYLLSNRSFPLIHFDAIQERVVRSAVASGIYLNDALQDVALRLNLATDEAELLKLLVANFAEVCISIRVNDLDAGDQWDNWDALLGLGDDLGVRPDPDVVELAEVSLKRAKELAEIEDLQDLDSGEAVMVDQTLIVSKHSEATGVTYFLPDDAVMDSFDDLAQMTREDLELLLNDSKGRLEAAQMLLEKFGGPVVALVLKKTEEMTVPEVAALARFIETKASGIEGELVRGMESGGPSATFVAAHGLSEIKSTTAMPALIEALRDPKRNGDKARLARTLSTYGGKLIPALSRVIKRDGADENLVRLLAFIEDVEDGTLGKLSKDRSKSLREAARRAREQRDS